MSSGRTMFCARRWRLGVLVGGAALFGKARPVPRFAGLTIAVLLAISAPPLDFGHAEEASKVRPVENKCDLSEVKGFERRSAARHQVTASFIVRPNDKADADEIRRFATHLRVFARLSYTRVHNASSGRCFFGGSVDASLNLTSELISIRQNEYDECSFARCVRALSNTIESVEVSREEFAATIDAIVKKTRRLDSVTFRYPGLAANNALHEVYRHIYLPGTRERMMGDISVDDFLHTRFEDFYEWFKGQQTALRNGHAEMPLVFSPTSQPGETLSPTNSRVEVEELNIDHHGWGHQSIILVDNVYERDGADVRNATLQALCYSNGMSRELEIEPWCGMVDRLSCHRDIVGEDKWFGIFSKKEPPATGVEMMRYARVIARLFESDQRAYLGLRIIVAKFL